MTVNLSGTLVLLEEACRSNVPSFVFTSSTSAFGSALLDDSRATAIRHSTCDGWSKNIYGVTKKAAEDLCQLFHRERGLAVVVLRTSRFFLEPDDGDTYRQPAACDDANLKLLELLHRRADVADLADAHLKAAARAPQIGFARVVVTADTPFTDADLVLLKRDAARVIVQKFPRVAALLAGVGWTLPTTIDRVYFNDEAKRLLQWAPKFNFEQALERLEQRLPHAHCSELAYSTAECVYNFETTTAVSQR